MTLSIHIHQERIMGELDRLAHYSDAPAPAVTRILYSPVDMTARAYIRQLVRDAGFEMREDGLGNTFIRWEGDNPNKAAVATGSHIDAIPFSGRYDGTVGVLGGLEALRALKESGYSPPRPLELIVFTAEEPTRFGLGCIGSRAMAGLITPDQLLALTDNDGQTLQQLRTPLGFTDSLDKVRLEVGHYHAFVELHIEQGRLLEEENLAIGIVTAIAAPATLKVEIRGEGGHAGAVLMPRRRDALTAASEIILAIEKIAQESDSADSVATVGLIDVHPSAVNSIPSQVTFHIDIRDITLESRNGMVRRIENEIKEIAQRRRVAKQIEVINADAPCTAGENVVSAIVSTSHQLSYPFKKLVSRAYHDALFMSYICPVGMILSLLKTATAIAQKNIHPQKKLCGASTHWPTRWSNSQKPNNNRKKESGTMRSFLFSCSLIRHVTNQFDSLSP